MENGFQAEVAPLTDAYRPELSLRRSSKEKKEYNSPPPPLLKGSYLKFKGSWSFASLNCNCRPGLLPLTEILSPGSSAEDNRRWLLGGQLSQMRVQVGLSTCRWVQGMQRAFCLTWQCFCDKHQKGRCGSFRKASPRHGFSCRGFPHGLSWDSKYSQRVSLQQKSLHWTETPHIVIFTPPLLNRNTWARHYRKLDTSLSTPNKSNMGITPPNVCWILSCHTRIILFE